jgi:hypothetical protein
LADKPAIVMLMLPVAAHGGVACSGALELLPPPLHALINKAKTRIDLCL